MEADQQAIAFGIDTMCAKVDSIVAKRKKLLKKLDALNRSLVYEYETGKKDAK